MTLASLSPLSAPTLSLRERDRRWAGLRRIMAQRDLAAIVVGSFQGRERLESYLIDDFLDAVVILPAEGDAVVVAFSASRLSRAYESERRGIPLWASDYRIGGGGKYVADVLQERGLARARIGLVGLGPTAPGEMEGLMPLGFHTNLLSALPQASFHDFTDDLTTFMLVKSEEEQALLRYAAQVTERACVAMAQTAAPGVSEAEVYAELMREIYRAGCDVRYPFLSLQSGPDNIGWGAPRWTLRAEPPRTLQRGDVVQAEIHTAYGGQEAQAQMCVALDPVDADLQRCEAVARASYEAGLRAIRPGVTFGEVVAAMEAPIAASKCWSKTPLLHTLTFGSTGFTPVNREQLAGTREEAIEGLLRPGVRRPGLVLAEGMGLELEPNACLGMKRVNIGGAVLVGPSGPEALNDIPTRVWHKR
ncbi:MAG: M24 family metallopeptidase [Pigmentiphaga sp.]|uniref:M24 family metallopeptidase n=1 Tax=Pigmentiphaga sp. TaxID=1977564 RepID=UPI0029BD8B57|nr:M24 family metallopeptidase [Pigmentiphaga sp.]MDX3905624.1 M24 family metallopeptidase [Pigmentiphaga sp.]